MSIPLHNQLGSKTPPGPQERTRTRVVPVVTLTVGARLAAIVVGTAAVAGMVATAPGGPEVDSRLSAPLFERLFAGPLDEAGEPITTLAAAVIDGDDFDGDGMTDAQEIVLGSSPSDVDTDFDGFSDSEEYARQSDPLEPSSVPMTDGVSASIAARGEDGKLRLVISLHEPNGPSTDTLIRIGALAQGTVLSVPIDRFLGLSDIRSKPGTNGSEITTIDIPINPAFVHANGQVTFFLAAGNSSTMIFGAAAKVDIVSDSGVLVIQRPIQANSWRQSSQGGGSIRQPIPVGAPPTQGGGWVPGSICYQRSEVIGINGPRMLHQVVEADCLEGWDSYCSSACAASLGSTYETIDPLALIGG